MYPFWSRGPLDWLQHACMWKLALRLIKPCVPIRTKTEFHDIIHAHEVIWKRFKNSTSIWRKHILEYFSVHLSKSGCGSFGNSQSPILITGLHIQYHKWWTISFSKYLRTVRDLKQTSTNRCRNDSLLSGICSIDLGSRPSCDGRPIIDCWKRVQSAVDV